MKIQFNGFDIEINQDDTNIAVKVMDANGKELSNNSYMQSTGSDEEEEIQDADVTPVEDVPTDEEGVEETPEEGESTEETEETEEETPEETEEEVGESYMPSFEDFKKKLKK